jgi:hypothetical protein
MRLAEHTHTHTYTCTHTHTHTHTHTTHTQNLNSYSCWLDMLSRVWRRSKSSTFACRSFICVFACLQAWQKINNVSLRGVSRARTPLPSHNLLQKYLCRSFTCLLWAWIARASMSIVCNECSQKTRQDQSRSILFFGTSRAPSPAKHKTHRNLRK